MTCFHLPVTTSFVTTSARSARTRNDVPTCLLPPLLPPKKAGGNGGGNARKTAIFSYLLPPSSHKEEKNMYRVIWGSFRKVLVGTEGSNRGHMALPAWSHQFTKVQDGAGVMTRTLQNLTRSHRQLGHSRQLPDSITCCILVSVGGSVR